MRAVGLLIGLSAVFSVASAAADENPSTSSATKTNPRGLFTLASAAIDENPSKAAKIRPPHSPPYFIAPINCPQHCVEYGHGSLTKIIFGEPEDNEVSSNNGLGTVATGRIRQFENAEVEFEPTQHLFVEPFTVENVKACDAGNINQRWYVHEIDNLLKFESAANLGECLGPSSFEGELMCSGELFELVPCHESASEWYATGGGFYSAECLRIGFSSAMMVNDDCTELALGDRSAAAVQSDAPIMRDQMFMLVESNYVEGIVPVPVPSSSPSSTQ